ncbi:hypothetical protein FMUND_954 [Fusarium mundagurra]|uniref:Uncharacterized protein n=1 Tax=Fusarium mundagurra TaxID=1567541 RepID=A0A8H5Z504_9HYPO|nr:hypothetical protein FMUND_954 [Fusarium mundagurra]
MVKRVLALPYIALPGGIHKRRTLATEVGDDDEIDSKSNAANDTSPPYPRPTLRTPVTSNGTSRRSLPTSQASGRAGDITTAAQMHDEITNQEITDTPEGSGE